MRTRHQQAATDTDPPLFPTKVSPSVSQGHLCEVKRRKRLEPKTHTKPELSLDDADQVQRYAPRLGLSTPYLRPEGALGCFPISVCVCVCVCMDREGSESAREQKAGVCSAKTNRCPFISHTDNREGARNKQAAAAASGKSRQNIKCISSYTQGNLCVSRAWMAGAHRLTTCLFPVGERAAESRLAKLKSTSVSKWLRRWQRAP